MTRKSRILVTGGAGFIGSHLVARLLKNKEEVTVVDDMSRGSLGNLGPLLNDPKLRVKEGDFADAKVLRTELPEASSVVHLAALTSVPYSTSHPKDVFEVNALKTQLLLEGSVKYSVGRFVLASTAAVYGSRDPPVREDMPLDPLSPYASSKVSAEALVQSYYHSYGLRSVILRFMNVYGLRSEGSNEGVISVFIAAIRRGKTLTVYGDGNQTRDFIHVSEVVDSILRALTTPHSHADVFNVGTGHATTINELVTTLQDLLPKRGLKVAYFAKRGGEVRHSFASTDKTSRLLGFRSSLELRASLLELLKEEGML